MKALQIANGYLDQKLYPALFSHLKRQGIESVVYVPVNRRRKDVPDSGPDVLTDRCFSDIDRVLFWSKQRNMMRGILKAIDIGKADIVHAHTLFSGGYCAHTLWQRYGIPYVAAVRNTDVNVFFRRMPHLRGIGVRIMRDAAFVVFLSPAYQKSVIGRYVPEKYREEILKKSAVIPNGIEPYFLENRPAPREGLPDTVRLIYVGEISPNKNVEATIRAAELLHREGVCAQLTVVGGIKDEKYRKLFDKTPFVRYFGHCPKEEVLKHLRGADIFVMPSHRETFGLAYAEALSQGLPVIYTKGQGFDGQFPEGEVGFRADDGSPRDIADKIRRVMGDYAGMSKRCILRAGDFDWTKIAGEYKKIYTDIVKGRK